MKKTGKILSAIFAAGILAFVTGCNQEPDLGPGHEHEFNETVW